MTFTILLFHSLITSTFFFLLLNSKLHVGLRHLFTDNLIIAVISTFFSYLFNESHIDSLMLTILLNTFMVPTLLGLTILIRSYRVPNRKTEAESMDIISPADGQVIYIKWIDANLIPLSVKNSVINKLTEFENMDILKTPCWLIGINITPFDVHRSAAPITGKIVLNKHFIGKKLNDNGKTENERNTIVIDNGEIQVGIIQIASRKGRHIETYIEENESIVRGEWTGMINFGSQVDVIIPAYFHVELNIKDQVYTGKSIIATN